jgi:tripartite ATP-independent transporter DctP family solute receptor
MVGAAVLFLTAGISCKQPESAQSQSASQSAAKTPQVLTMTFAPAENSPHHKAGLQFGKLVEERTQGAYTVTPYPNSSLAGGNQLGAIEMVQNGSISCGWLSPLVHAAIEPNLNAMSIPWLWKDVATIDATMKSGTAVDKEINRLLNQKGFHVVGYAENGFRELTNNVRPIKTPEDMRRIKFRVIGSRMLLDVFTAFGANPVDINFAELYTALQQHTVDGQENPISTIIIPNRYYEVQKYLTIWSYSYEPHPLSFNKALWDSFSPDAKAGIMAAAGEACTLQKKLAREALDEDKKTVAKTTEIYTLTAEELQKFKDIAQPAIEKHLSSFDTKLIEALYEANK